MFSIFCLSLHQSNSRLENISVFIYPSPIQQETKNLFLGRTTTGGALPPPHPTHPPTQVTPLKYGRDEENM
jgi:hypothetical protein